MLCVSTPSGSKSSSESSSCKWDDLKSVSEKQEVNRTQFSRKNACREHFNNAIDEKFDAFHCLRRLG